MKVIRALLLGLFCVTAARAEVTVSAAISLKPALEQARPILEAAAGEKISFNFGASGTLASQIQQGAPVDLFISADRATVQKLLDAEAAQAGSDRAIAGNELVLIFSRLSSHARPAGFSDLPKLDRIAIGDPKTVPAGVYARQTLTALKLYDDLDKTGKILTAENVSQVLTLVQRGDVEAGIVYATDAKAAGNLVDKIATADPATHGTIEYVSVLVAGSAHHEAAARIQRALLEEKVRAILQELGFTPPPTFKPQAQPDTVPMPATPAYLHPWLLSLEVALVATGINALTAVPLSYLLARRRFPLRWLVDSLVILPLVVPPTVVGFALMLLIGRSGLYGVITGHTLLFTRLAAVLASSVVSFPLMVLPVRAAFAAIPREYFEEARMAGLSAFQRFIHVALPLARGGIISGLLLVFARALGEFGATVMVLGTTERTLTLPIKIYQDTALSFDYGAAWPSVVLLALTSMAVILAANKLRWLEAEK